VSGVEALRKHKAEVSCLQDLHAQLAAARGPAARAEAAPAPQDLSLRAAPSPEKPE